MGLSLFAKKQEVDFFNVALAKDDLNAFRKLFIHPIAEAFNSSQENWLTLAFKNKKIVFIDAFFDTHLPFTAEEVNSLTSTAIDTLLNTFEAALHHPRLYHTVEGLLTKAILPIMAHLPNDKAQALQAELNKTYYPKILEALPFVKVSLFQTTIPQTKSTQLLGLLMKHGFIEHCTPTPNQGTVSIHFKGCANTGLQPRHFKITRSNKKQDYAYYVNTHYLLQHNATKANPALLLCHHYFHLKQEAIASKKDRLVFNAKLNEFITVLDLINQDDAPATAVKKHIEGICATQTGHSDLRDTLYPLASMSDDELKQAYAAYLNHLKSMAREDLRDDIMLDKKTVLQALYCIRSNPFIKINDYLENKNAKRFERKQKMFEGIKSRINAIKETPNEETIKALRTFIKENLYASKPQPIAAPQVKSVTAAHAAWPHRGEFASLISPLKHWDMPELVIKFDQFNGYLDSKFEIENASGVRRFSVT